MVFKATVSSVPNNTKFYIFINILSALTIMNSIHLSTLRGRFAVWKTFWISNNDFVGRL